jgi:hypothetical protein
MEPLVGAVAVTPDVRHVVSASEESTLKVSNWQFPSKGLIIWLPRFHF